MQACLNSFHTICMNNITEYPSGPESISKALYGGRFKAASLLGNSEPREPGAMKARNIGPQKTTDPILGVPND